MAGQWVLLVLKAGYLTNTTYGYIKWNKYIKEHKNVSQSPENSTKEENNDDEKIEKDMWDRLTDKYLSVGSDKIEWVILFEETT